MKKALVLLAFFVGYLVLLAGINIIHFRFFTVNVVFYAALADAVIACAIMWGLAAFAHTYSSPASYVGTVIRRLTNTEIALSAACALLIGYVFAISIPTVIDRSLSIYILEKLDQRGGAISLDAMNEIFVKEYMPEYRLMDVRMTEQLSSGTLTIEDGCVQLTPRGKRIVGLTRFYRTKILPKKRVLMGEVTSDLTDPFRNGASAVDYRCHATQPPAEGRP